MQCKDFTGLIAAILLMMSWRTAEAQCPSLPYNLTNGQTADASQVMANLNQILTCINSASSLQVTGSGGGIVSIQNPSATSNYSFNLPSGPGSTGQILVSGGSSAPMTWATVPALSNDFSLIASVNVGTAGSFVITGLNTTLYDYRLSIRASRPSSGATSSDYINIQFGDATTPTPNLFSTTIYTNYSGAAYTNLASSGGVAAVAQVQNASTTYMGATLDMQFSGDGLAVSALAHSYFWENISQLDQGPNSSAIGSIKVTIPNQSWNVTYSLWQIRR